MDKLKFKKINIGFLMLSLIFSSLMPSLSFAAEELDLGETRAIQLESDIQELMLPLPEETKPEPVINNVDLIEDPIDLVDPVVVEDPINGPDILEEVPIDDLLKPLEELDGEKDASGVTPLDMYDNRDNSGLKPKDQTGQYNVDEFTGVFSYSYSIQIPKGRNGLEPSIVLNYNHRRSNVGSYLGFGWESSIPSIERENRTGIDNIYNENYFVLNGSQIVPISVDANGYGTYGKLVEADFSKIEFDYTNKWIVTDKLGTIYTYGLSVSARQDNPSNSSQVYKWMLEEVRDTNDNFVRYEYYKDSGQIYPKKIVYTGNGVSDGIFTVNFEPFATGVPTENNLFNSSYQTGFEVKTKYLLDRIDVKIENDLVTSYDLNLSLNTNQNKYLLDSITPTFYSEGQSFVKDQEEFDYSYQATTYAEGEGYQLPNNYHLGENIGTFSNKRDMFIDLNSDSFPDYIRTVCDNGNLSVNVWENNGQGAWATSTAYNQSIGNGFTCGGLYGVRYSMPLSFAEMNGDHLIDMVTDTNVYYNNGSGWDAPVASTLPVSLFQSSGPGTPPMNVVMFSDMNRDGYDDIIYNYHPNNSTAKVDVYMKDSYTGNWNLDNDYNKEIVFDSSECMWAGDPFDFTDINNDGLLDIFYDYYCYYPGPYPESVNEGYSVYLNTGYGLELTTNYVAPIETMRYVWDSGSIEQQVDYLSDIDSDGIRDQGLYWRNKWSTVTGQWSQGSISLLGQEIFNTGIIGGYGYYDITIPVAVADFNGDQVQDTMHSWGSTDKVYYGQGSKLDILNQVNYQSGANVGIRYDYSTNEKDSSANLLNPELPFDLYVAKEVVINDGLDNRQGIQYQYEDGKSESYPDKKIKDVYGFSKVSKKIAQALPDVDLGDGSNGAYVSNGNETWTTNKNFTSLHIQSGHTITVEPEVVIKVQGEAIIDGVLDAKGKGFSGGGQVAWGGASGQGPGAGGGGYGGIPNVTTCGGGGAGHLTVGETGQGCQAGYALGGSIYGNEELNPIIKGSGGGGAGDILGVQGGWGGAGGGAIQVFADSIEVNGSIDVDANNGYDGQSMSGIYAGGGGGGSGGSVYIKVVETADIGSNLIHAKGGQGGNGGYFNNGGDGADGRIRVEAKNIIGSTDPVYYSSGHFNYSIDNGLDVNLQKTVNEYHIAADDNFYLHGKLKSSGSYDKQDNLLSKQFSAWQYYDLDANRKFVYQENQIHTEAHLLEEGSLQEYSSDANTIALYHTDGLLGSTEKKDNAQGNVAYDLTEQNIDAIDVGFNNEENGAYRSLGDTRLLNTHIQGLGGGAFTIEIWAKHNGGKIAANRLLGNRNYYDQGFYVEYDWANSRILFYSSGDRYVWTAYSEPGSIRLGEWQHFAFIMDTNNAYIYVDGELSGQSSVTMVENPVVNTDLVFFCGRSICNDAGLFSIDEVRVSNTARLGSEIYNYYHNTQEPYYEISQAKENNYNFTNGNLETENSLGKVVANINTGQITDELTGDEKDTNYDYALNTTKHILSAPKNKIISDSSDSKEQDLYYDNLALGEVDKVNLTKEDYISQDVEINRNFNSYGLVAEEISPENATTTIAYDTFNLYPASSTNPLNQTSYTEFNLLNGQVATSTSAASAQTVNKYDAYGRIIEVKISDPDSPTTLITKQEISYNDSSLPRYTETKNYFDVSSYSTAREYYDGLGRTIQKKAQTAITGEYSTVDIIYDSQGRVSQQSLPYITSSLEYGSADLSKPSKAYTYDALDRVLTESTPVGITSYEYNGWATIITDPNGNRKDLTKDAYGNLIEVKEYNNNGSNIYTTDYEYSLTNKLKKITDSAGNIRNFSYDALDNLEWQDMVHTPSVANPAKIQYTYDKNGNVLTETSFKNDAISYVYDDLNRVLFEKLSGVNQISYSYDQNNDVGQLSFADYGSNNSKAYDYDILGRLRTATTTIESEVFVLKYDYNLNGDVKEIEYPNGWKVAYSFNSIGQINSVSLDKGQGPVNIASNIVYNQNGQMTHLERANGVVTDYTYDPDEAFRLTNILTSSASVTFQDLSYIYDNVGNITDIVDNSDTDLAKSVHYNYDDLNRLLSADVSYTNHPADDYTQTFEYSSIGNMTYNSSLGTMNYTNGQPHQLSGYGTRTFLYDNAGNMKGNQIDKFGWDWRNRLKSSYNIASENSTYYKYDHNNQRFLKYTEELVFIPPDPQESIPMESMLFGEELDGAGGGTYELQRVKEDKYIEQYFEKDTVDNTKSHIFLNSTKIATANNNDNPYYILSDNLDSNSILIDNTGSLAQSSDYKPFGEIVYNNTITDLKNDYKFTGKESDEENALQYYGARYLDNQIAKFISVEPVMLVLYDGKKVKSISGQELNKILSDPQGLNSYSYSRNNPIILVDTDGNWWKELITRQQSWSDFQVELGQAANQLYNDSGTAKAAMDHPGYAGAVIGVGSGLAALGGSALLGQGGLFIHPIAGPLGFNVGKNFDKIKDSGVVRTAYETASRGGPNAGMLERYKNVPINQIQKGIQSLEDRALQHLQYIKDPSSYSDFKTFKTLSDVAQKQTYHYWYQEAERYMSQASVLKGVIKDIIK